MKKKQSVLTKDLLKRKNFLKNEIKQKIFKSILQNFQIKPIIRVEALRKLIIYSKKCNISKQNNICILSGRFGGVFKKWNISRHQIKNMSKLNLLTNTKVSNF